MHTDSSIHTILHFSVSKKFSQIMKLLSELGSCFSSSSATAPPSAAESCLSGVRSSSRLRDDDQRSCTSNSGGDGGSGIGISNEVTVPTVRKIKSTKSSRNWKPKLNVISEDSVVVMNRDLADNKLSVKVKAKKSKPKLPLTYVSGDYYWKPSKIWALPAFSPAPFAF